MLTAQAYSDRVCRRFLWASRTWAIASGLALVVFAAEVGLPAGAASAQSSRPQVPLFEPDPLWSQALPNKWVNGQVGGVAVDSHDNVWVFHRPATIADDEKAASLNPPRAECCIPAPSVLEFGPTGKFLQAWGGPGQGYEWSTSEHGIFVDDKDNVWLSGSAKEDNQILKFTNKGKFLMQIGHKGKNKGSNDTENLGGPAGLFVYQKTNELFVADGYFNHRVIVFDAITGRTSGTGERTARSLTTVTSSPRAESFKDRRPNSSTIPCTRCW